MSEISTADMLEWLDVEAWALTNPMAVGEWQDKSRAIIPAIRAALLERDALKAEVEELRLQLKYPDPEDMPGELAAKYCPFKDPLHFHHDGCPSEWAIEERAKKAETEVERLDKENLE